MELPPSDLARWARQCALVVPCYNEGANIGGLVSQLKNVLPSVIVVDDGSTDETGRAAAQAGAFVVRHPENQGKGAALRTGLQKALELGHAWALCLDGDGQHAPADIPAFLACADRDGAALIVGNRFHAPDRIPPVRRWVNRWLTCRLSRLTGETLLDSQCGFRLVRLDVWAKLRLQADRFEVESEFLVQFLRAGERVRFVPVQVIYRGAGSKIRPFRDTWRWLRWWWNQPRPASPANAALPAPLLTSVPAE
jgi:glycosyltransferase involved in cell wall biosynthesis